MQGREGRQSGEDHHVLRDGGQGGLEGILMNRGHDLGCLLRVLEPLFEKVGELGPLYLGCCQLGLELGLGLLKGVHILVDFF